MLTAAHLPEIQGAYEDLPIAAATADRQLRIQWLNPDAARRFPFLKLSDGMQTLLYPSSPTQALQSLQKGESVSLACGVPPAVGCTVSLIPAMREGSLEQVLLLIADGFCASAPMREPTLASGMFFSRLRANLAICFGVTEALKKQGVSREHGVYLDILDNRCQCLLREFQNLSALSRFLQGAPRPSLLYGNVTDFLQELSTWPLSSLPCPRGKRLYSVRRRFPFFSGSQPVVKCASLWGWKGGFDGIGTRKPGSDWGRQPWISSQRRRASSHVRPLLRLPSVRTFPGGLRDWAYGGEAYGHRPPRHCFCRA